MLVGASRPVYQGGPDPVAIQRYNERHPDSPIHEVLAHTGQHYDHEMSGSSLMTWA